MKGHKIATTESHNCEMGIVPLVGNVIGIGKNERKTPTPKQEPQIQRQETNPTDKYIQLLKDGLIDKADFLKLMSGNKMETDGYIY